MGHLSKRKRATANPRLDRRERRDGVSLVPVPRRAQRDSIAELFQISTQSDELRLVLNYARRVAATPYPILIQGETGTGKELLARGIHEASGLSGAFTAVNCGSIPESLFEAELFGAERGAYTGLDSARLGLFQIADKGTLFLDEIAEMPLAGQAKLLRVLQDGEVKRLGSPRSTRVRVRVIAATHRDMKAMVVAGSFRKDLFYRLQATSLTLPPLRERLEDVPLLLAQGLADAAATQGVMALGMDDTVIESARRYAWPGNVRELLHAVAGALLRAGQRPVSPQDFPMFELDDESAAVERPANHAHSGALPYADVMAAFEGDYLRQLLAQTDGNLSHAARVANLPRSTLRDKLRRHGLAEQATPAHSAVGGDSSGRHEG